MAILSTNQRLINVGDSYSAGNGIDITNNIISVTGDNAPYSAGDNIDIQDHIISGKDWSNDIENASANAYNVTTAWVQDNYANSADMTYISAMVDTKLDTSAWSSVSSNFATEDYVIMADNITYDRAKGYVDSKGFATEEFVNENTSGKLDSSSFDTWQQGQYTNDIAGLNNLIGTKLDASSFEETSGTFYPTSNPSGFITGVDLSNYYQKNETSSKEEISDAIAAIPLGDEEVNQVVHTNSSTWNTVTDKLDITAQVISSYTTASIEGTSLVVSLNDKPLNAYRAVSAQDAGIADKAKYDYEGNNLVDDHNSLTALSDFVQSNSGTIDDAVTTYQSNSANYITAHQSLEGLMSASLLESADGKWTAYNSIPFKAGDEFPASADEAIQCVQSNSSNWQSVSNKLDSDVFTAWSATQADNNYQLSAGDGISIIDDDINKITRIDCTVTGGDMFTAYLEYNDQNQISGYAGSAFAGQGGGGNPEVENYVQTNSAQIDETVTSFQTNSSTYMVEPNLEYNAVGEISGYGNSAIAQYGAEKQWLVHDDTIVSISNSAQYALGVAIDNVARLMGVDETVLWSGSSQISTGSYIELNETPFNFDRVRIEYAHQAGWGGKHSETIPEFGRLANGKFVIGENWFRAAAGYNNMWHNLSYETFDSATNRIYHNSGFQGVVNNTAWNTNGDLPINYYKIVGIGRKS